MFVVKLGFVFFNVFRDSSMVEHSAVNRRVAGSSPARGAKKSGTLAGFLFNMYHTYVLHSPTCNQIYIGHTNSLKLRFQQHNNGLSKSTKRYIPWKLLFYEKFETRAEAMKRERELKSHKGRDFIRQLLLNGGVRQLPD